MKSKSLKLFHCPCCGQATLGEIGAYESCPVCLWEDDPVQSADPKYAGGANQLSLEEARQKYMASKSK